MQGVLQPKYANSNFLFFEYLILSVYILALKLLEA